MLRGGCRGDAESFGQLGRRDVDSGGEPDNGSSSGVGKGPERVVKSFGSGSSSHRPSIFRYMAK
jgi:hypothetical protein